MLDEEIWISFGFNIFFIFFAIFSAKEKISLDNLSGLERCSFGITKICPLDIGFISRIAIASLSSSI